MLTFATEAAAGTLDTWLEVFGRGHIVLVHFPIAILMVALLFALFGWRKSTETSRGGGGAIIGLTLLGFLSAAAAAGSGWLYEYFEFGGGDDQTMGWHRWLGVATAVVAVVSLILVIAGRDGQKRGLRNGARLALLAGALLVGFAGHYGGAMVHGDNHLWAPLMSDDGPAPQPTGTDPDALAAQKTDPATADPGDAATDPGGTGAETDPPEQAEPTITFVSHIRPLFETHCVNCHGPQRQRAQLRLDEPAVFMASDDRALVVPGDPDGSEVVRRIELPEDHDDHMPPRGEPVTAEGMALIRQWIAQGALLEVASTTAVAVAPTETTAAARAAESAHDPAPPPAPIALGADARADRDAALARLNERGALAKRLALNDDAVEVSFALLGSAITDGDLDLLTGLESSLVWLDLAGTAITDEGVASLASFSALRRVELQRTSITDAALTTLADLPDLRVINLHQTAVTDDGIQVLRPHERLQRLYLWDTQVSPTGAANLRAARPELEIDLGGPAAWPN